MKRMGGVEGLIQGHPAVRGALRSTAATAAVRLPRESRLRALAPSALTRCPTGRPSEGPTVGVGASPSRPKHPEPSLARHTPSSLRFLSLCRSHVHGDLWLLPVVVCRELSPGGFLGPP